MIPQPSTQGCLQIRISRSERLHSVLLRCDWEELFFDTDRSCDTLNRLSMATQPVISPESAPSAKPVHVDLEVKDAHLIFNSVWNQLVGELGPEGMRFPRELILLGGAPGAGKGTNTPFILQSRGLTCDPIVISSLLDNEEEGGTPSGQDLFYWSTTLGQEPDIAWGAYLCCGGVPAAAKKKGAGSIRLVRTMD